MPSEKALPSDSTKGVGPRFRIGTRLAVARAAPVYAFATQRRFLLHRAPYLNCILREMLHTKTREASAWRKAAFMAQSRARQPCPWPTGQGVAARAPGHVPCQSAVLPLPFVHHVFTLFVFLPQAHAHSKHAEVEEWLALARRSDASCTPHAGPAALSPVAVFLAVFLYVKLAALVAVAVLSRSLSVGGGGGAPRGEQGGRARQVRPTTPCQCRTRAGARQPR